MTNKDSKKQLPSGWSEDRLSKFFDDAFGNVLATFTHKKPQFSFLLSVDDCYRSITENLSVTQELLEPLFLIRSHAAYRAGAQLAMSGQTTESFCVLRSCLEFALYGLHISKNPFLGNVWLLRHKDKESLSRVRSEFSNRKVIRTLECEDPVLWETINSLYERTIDYGGHPNERSITSNISMISSDDEVSIKQLYLNGDSLALEHGLKSAAQIGLGALYIYRNVYRERFDILDVTTTLDELRSFL